MLQGDRHVIRVAPRPVGGDPGHGCPGEALQTDAQDLLESFH